MALGGDSDKESLKQIGKKHNKIGNDDEFFNLQQDIMDLKKELNNIKKDMSNKRSSNVENISESVQLRKQINQLENQVVVLSSVVLKLESDDKNEGSEKRMESDIHLRHENQIQTQLRLQNIDNQKGKKVDHSVYKTRIKE